MKNNKKQEIFELKRDEACFVPEGLIFFNATQGTKDYITSQFKTYCGDYCMAFQFHFIASSSSMEQAYQ